LFQTSSKKFLTRALFSSDTNASLWGRLTPPRKQACAAARTCNVYQDGKPAVK
jgi:hypothetical protein